MRNWLAASSVVSMRSRRFSFGGMRLRALICVAAQAAVEALVAGVVEDAEHAVLHAGLAGRAGEGLELLARSACAVPAAPGRPPSASDNLLPAGLDGEVLLGDGDLRLARVAVLGDQVAGEAGEVVISHFPDGTFASSIILRRCAK